MSEIENNTFNRIFQVNFSAYRRLEPLKISGREESERIIY